MPTKASSIATALFARAALMETQGPNLPVAFPEVAFAPPADGKYLEVALVPNVVAWEGMTDGRRDQGLLKVMVVWPKNLGQVKPFEAAGQVMAHFAKGGAYFADGVKVTITGEPYLGPPLPDDTSVSIPVMIPWQA